jgi:membrane-associated protease RseP (regulator of RpoE activity)
MANEPLSGFPAPLGAPPRFEEPRFEEPRVASTRPPRRERLWLHFLLFGLTLISMQVTSMNFYGGAPPGHTLAGYAAYQALSLLGILLVHELGHYIAARLHRVPASPPYFLPLPLLGFFGTLGAVITMDDRIRSRKALLDIGAAGPIAGMVVALPVLAWGLKLSEVAPLGEHYMQEGQSILYWLMKRLVLGPIPEGHDVQLHPMAFAGWGGMMLTMINLLPWGQLDGGHIAFALFGEQQNRFARWVRRGMLAAFAYNIYVFVVPVLLGRSSQGWDAAIMSSTSWLVWYGVTGIMSRVSGPEHPPFEPEPLGRGRQLVAVGCLLLFVLLFLPTPVSAY